MEKEKRWEELEKKYKDLIEEIDKEFPEAYLDISVAFMGYNGNLFNRMLFV